ncbi:MAG: hypothetical protein KF699_15985 [Phycisphaeraceae bacterium]|nr:hypothetical protein [Phycisphaeraceae bacterium]
MHSAAACLCAALTAAAVIAVQPPADEGSPPADALNTWKERAARAQAWLKDKAASAEQAAAETLARARRELLGIEGEVHAPVLALAMRPAAGGPVSWETLTTDAPARPGAAVVLLVHGLDEPGPIWDELTPHLLDHGAAVVRFDYPNDQGIADSAAQLLAALRDLRSRGVERVQIVAHSMGGLLARDALTREDGYAGDGSTREGLAAITHLIMVGTPNHGSHLARLQPIADAREHAIRAARKNSTDGAGLVGSARDGRGEAARDLAIGSEFLTALNARPLPEGVRITTISGTLTPAAACEYLRTDAQPQWARLIGEERAAALIAQSCAAVETLGDGMVHESSTRLDGVSDHVELAADHRSLLKRWTILVKLDELRDRATPPAAAIPVILDRLGLAPIAAPDSAPVP